MQAGFPTATECFLRHLVLPEDDELRVDLRQCAVVIASYLDKIAHNFLPPSGGNMVSSKTYSVSREAR